MTKNTIIQIENLDCPYCEAPHLDIDEWAIKPHRTHLCLQCKSLFEGKVKAVSRPQFIRLPKPLFINYKE